MRDDANRELIRQRIEKTIQRLVGLMKAPGNRLAADQRAETRPESIVSATLVKCGASVQTARLDKGAKYNSPKKYGYNFAVPFDWEETVQEEGLSVIEGMICLEAKRVQPPDVCDGCWKVILAKMNRKWELETARVFAVAIAEVVRIGNDSRGAYERCCKAHLEALGIQP